LMFLCLSPLLILVSLVIRLDSRGPILFSQERVGENGEIFTIYKFRSMRTDAETISGPVWAEEDDPRITRVGRIIRKLRIDELPQLWNVLKGDMSFVGPRPERPYFVEKLKKSVPYYNQRFAVKPGVTGWAQIKYPYGATEQDALEKLKYDLYYIKNMSLLMDLLVIFHTVKTVLLGRGSR
jgi:exopolysaccharide biosynthesis polyprenyl glycosylphosphotransferase